MKIHRNAKTTAQGRHLLLRRVNEGWTMTAATAAIGLSTRSGYKWQRRQRAGDTLLADASSRPRRQPRQTPVAVQAQVVALRQQRWPGWRIAHALGMPRSTVTCLLKRAGLNRLPRLTSPVPVLRCEWAAAGDPPACRHQGLNAHRGGRPPDPWRPPADAARHRPRVRACSG